MIHPDLQTKLDTLITQSDVVLFMKWDPSAPKCGFSAWAIQILEEEGLEYSTFNILEDEEVRQWLKEYKNWPTYPQLYIKWELIGGIDIMNEMQEAGEFKQFKH